MRDRQLVMEAAGFLTESVASRFIRDCIQLTVTPTDGEALKAALHTRGINIRYLGFIAQIAAKREDLRHLMVRGGGGRGGGIFKKNFYSVFVYPHSTYASVRWSLE